MAEHIQIAIPGGGYEVVVGDGLLDSLGALLREVPIRPARGVVVTSKEVNDFYGDRVRASLATMTEVHTVVIDDGEQAKNLDTLRGVFTDFATIPLNRGDLVIALGGGVVGDLAGFAAATWNRGTPVVQVPTTLLAQVDSSVGGKTGINVAEGKNLVGAFHQPVLVVSDIATLTTLPRRELMAGMGEILKYGFIVDPQVLHLLETSDGLTEPEVLHDLVSRSVRVKAEIVAADEREAGRRMVLNYGHTIGHAIEALTGYTQFRHGEAVGLGMIVAARVGEAMGISRPGLAKRTVDVLKQLDLPTGGVQLDFDEVWRIVGRDKKAVGGTVRMVLCQQPGQTVVVDDPPVSAIRDALERIG